jgi:DNA-directed RNA polymerase alpha subunit
MINDKDNVIIKKENDILKKESFFRKSINSIKNIFKM